MDINRSGTRGGLGHYHSTGVDSCCSNPSVDGSSSGYLSKIPRSFDTSFCLSSSRSVFTHLNSRIIIISSSSPLTAINCCSPPLVRHPTRVIGGCLTAETIILGGTKNNHPHRPTRRWYCGSQCQRFGGLGLVANICGTPERSEGCDQTRTSATITSSAGPPARNRTPTPVTTLLGLVVAAIDAVMAAWNSTWLWKPWNRKWKTPRKFCGMFNEVPLTTLWLYVAFLAPTWNAVEKFRVPHKRHFMAPEKISTPSCNLCPLSTSSTTPLAGVNLFVRGRLGWTLDNLYQRSQLWASIP